MARLHQVRDDRANHQSRLETLPQHDQERLKQHRERRLRSAVKTVRVLPQHPRKLSEVGVDLFSGLAGGDVLLHPTELIFDGGSPIPGDVGHDGLFEAQLLVVTEVGVIHQVLGRVRISAAVGRTGVVDHHDHVIDHMVPGPGLGLRCTGGTSKRRRTSDEDEKHTNQPTHTAARRLTA